MKAIKLVISRYRNRETMLFANNREGTIPRTNNGMEQLFRKLRRNIRKRCGNIATGNMLANNGVSLAIFQNIENKDYVKAVFGNWLDPLIIDNILLLDFNFFVSFPYILCSSPPV